MNVKLLSGIILSCLLAGNILTAAEESLPPLKDGKAPTNLDELWGNYDPGKEPLDTQVVREWKEGDITYRYVVFTIGTFKGQKSRLAAFYAFPKSDKKLPAIMQVHGGGQRAQVEAVTHAAVNGYAGLSINWGGNDMERMEKGDPNTDWGALDATQKHHNSHYSSMKPDAKTLDAVESPRNNNWFLLVLSARRGLTFLEQQPEVDPERLGVTGHSMGGKITVNVAGIDKRVKAAVPSCGGAGSVSGKLSGMPGSGLTTREGVALETIDDLPYISRVMCPILFMAPSNDFAGPIDNMMENWKKIGSRELAFTIAPHLNHRGLAETGICGILWFDQYLKGAFSFPKTPELTVSLKTPNGIPQASLKTDRPAEVVKADLYYSVDPHCLTRFWRDAEAKKSGDIWLADCPVMSTAQPLFVYANVSYVLKTERIGARGSKPPESFIISSWEAVIFPEDLVAAGVKATDQPSRMIDDFSRGWQDWYRLEWGNPHHWVATTRKLKDPKWQGPEGARLVFEVRCPTDIVLTTTVDLNKWGSFPGKPGGSYAARKPIKGSADWQTVSISLNDMLSNKKGDAAKLTSWETVTELSFGWAPSYLQDGQEVKFGTDAKGWGEPREFRNLRWEGGVDSAAVAAPAAGSGAVPQNLEETIQKEIKKSIDQEKRDK